MSAVRDLLEDTHSADSPNFNRLPAILDGKYFQIIKTEKDGRVEANCVMCFTNGERRATFKGDIQVTSNFTTHLKRKHPESAKEYDQYKLSQDLKKKRLLPTAQGTLSFPVVRKVSAVKTKTEQSIVDFIVDSMSPLQIVDTPAFKTLCKALNPDAHIPCRKTIRLKIASEFEIQQQKIADKLKSSDCVCCTADIWSTKTRSFMGMTAHWISESFERKSAVLTMRRFSGKHTFDKIAELLSETFQTFGIEDKTVSVVTDNGSNFVKAFKEFGLDLEEESQEENDPFDECEDVEHVDTSEIDCDDLIKLPYHIRCASHTLSLVATKDINKEPKDGDFDKKTRTSVKRVMGSAFAKTSALFNKASRSVQVCEAFNRLTGKAIVKPVPTRWNSFYDALRRLLEVKEKLDEVFEIAEVEKFKRHDIEFIEEYVLAMKPIASALDTLQSENDFFYGLLAPVITTAHKELSNLKLEETPYIYASFIAERLKEGLIKRFGSILKRDEQNAKTEILSAILLPWFKLRWVPEKERQQMKLFLINQSKAFSGKDLEKSIDHFNADSDKWGKYFSEDEQANKTKSRSSEANVELECLTYLQDPDNTLHGLKKFPTLMSMFFKFNTTLPSSAPSERCFNYAKMILRPQRSRLSDDVFEHLALLKINRLYAHHNSQNNQ